MENKKIKTTGSIRISTDVILKIAETAAVEVDGVYSVNQSLPPITAKAKVFGAIQAKITGESTAITMEIAVLEGHNAVNIAEEIQKNVKSAIQNMTGFAVTKVDVAIVAIKIKKNP